MVLKVATRGQVPPFIVMDVMRAAAAREATGASVLHLEVGQPGGNAPQAALDAGIAALRNGRVAYTDALGIPALREGIAKHYRDFYGLSVPAERIAVTTGSSGAFILSFLASFDAGDRVALAAPGYPAYRNILKALDIEPVLLETDLEHRFQPTPELLDAVGKVDGLIVASPANPTGTVLSTEALGALAKHCRAKGIRLVSDEIYHGITYGQKVATAAALDDEAIVVNSFSKYFSMTGWRLGWLVLPKSLLRAVECLAQNFFISPPAVSQMAGLAALNCYEELDARVAGYARNRAILLDGLPKAGIDKMAPADGAFYIYADIGHLTNDSPGFCQRALEEIGVAITPGTDFDPARGHRTLRISFAGKEAEIAEATRRLIAWIKK